MRFSPNGNYGERSENCPIGVLHDGDGAVVGHGLNICHIPVGENGFVQRFLSSKAAVIKSNINKIKTELNDFSNEAWIVVCKSATRQWDYRAGVLSGV